MVSPHSPCIVANHRGQIQKEQINNLRLWQGKKQKEGKEREKKKKQKTKWAPGNGCGQTIFLGRVGVLENCGQCYFYHWISLSCGERNFLLIFLFPHLKMGWYGRGLKDYKQDLPVCLFYFRAAGVFVILRVQGNSCALPLEVDQIGVSEICG